MAMLNPKDWSVFLIEPNKYEARIASDLLTQAGVRKIRCEENSANALEVLQNLPATVILIELGVAPLGALEWVRHFRRDTRIGCRRTGVFVMTKALSRTTVEAARIAGANAIIGKPMSGASLMATIGKVMSTPRPFVECAAYVGPCRRAGIISTCAVDRRQPRGAQVARLQLDDKAAVVGALLAGAADLVSGAVLSEESAARLQQVEGMSLDLDSGGVLRGIAASLLRLGAHKNLDASDRAVLASCMEALQKLAAAGPAATRAAA